MSLPNLPDITPNINFNRGDAINMLLASIALEELGLAHIINAEAEKIQYVLGTLEEKKPVTPPSLHDLMKVNKSVNRTLRTVVKNQMLLQFKLEDLSESPLPSIKIKVYVSNDNGKSWHNADCPPGLIISPGQNPLFKFVVVNTGDVKLSGISVNCSLLGMISVGEVLAPGAYFEKIKAGTFMKGEHSCSATVIGYYLGQQVEDSDIAYFTGVK